MFVTGITERVELDGGEWIEIRKLSAKHLANAVRAREREVAESVRAFGGDVMTAIQSARANGVTDTAEQPRPLDGAPGRHHRLVRRAQSQCAEHRRTGRGNERADRASRPVAIAPVA
mgnify:CR=1 FL=1